MSESKRIKLSTSDSPKTYYFIGDIHGDIFILLHNLFHIINIDNLYDFTYLKPNDKSTIISLYHMEFMNKNRIRIENNDPINYVINVHNKDILIDIYNLITNDDFYNFINNKLLLNNKIIYILGDALDAYDRKYHIMKDFLKYLYKNKIKLSNNINIPFYNKAIPNNKFCNMIKSLIKFDHNEYITDYDDYIYELSYYYNTLCYLVIIFIHNIQKCNIFYIKGNHDTSKKFVYYDIKLCLKSEYNYFTSIRLNDTFYYIVEHAHTIKDMEIIPDKDNEKIIISHAGVFKYDSNIYHNHKLITEIDLILQGEENEIENQLISKLYNYCKEDDNTGTIILYNINDKQYRILNKEANFINLSDIKNFNKLTIEMIDNGKNEIEINKHFKLKKDDDKINFYVDNIRKETINKYNRINDKCIYHISKSQNIIIIYYLYEQIYTIIINNSEYIETYNKYIEKSSEYNKTYYDEYKPIKDKKLTIGQEEKNKLLIKLQTLKNDKEDLKDKLIKEYNIDYMINDKIININFIFNDESITTSELENFN